MERITLNRHPVLFRFFMVTDGGIHYSMLRDDEFRVGSWYDAVCKVYGCGIPHPAPNEDCSCGFYVFTNAGAASRELQSSHVNIAHIDSVVLAAVEIDGRVCRHENGLRVERMRILRSWPVNDGRAWAAAEALERVYKQSPLYRPPMPEAGVDVVGHLRMFYGG